MSYSGCLTLRVGLINAMDADALSTKLSKCKDLFYILDDHSLGSIATDDLRHELSAGRISEVVY